MTIQRLPRRPDELGALSLFVQLDVPREGAAVGDQVRQTDFLEKVRGGLSRSLASPARLHGWHVQEMFAGMVLGLGQIRLLSVEDEGDCYFDDSSGPVKKPDFRLVTNEGEHLLIEVKNVPPADLDTAWSMRLGDLDALRRYADLTGARLLVANYWTSPNIWTLVSAELLARRGKKAALRLVDAYPKNELGRLGDRMIATTPPLTLSLLVDQKGSQLSQAGDKATTVSFRIGAVEIASTGRVLEEKMEQEIAWRLMLLGGWTTIPHAGYASDGTLARVDYNFMPLEQDEQADFQIVGSLSSMHATLYNLATMGDQGEFLSLRREAAPGELLEIIPRSYWQRDDRLLPLWQFELQAA